MDYIKILITGGHITPAIAVIEELQKRKNWKIFFIGRKYAAEGDKTLSIEKTLIPKMGIDCVFINPGRIQKRFTRWTIPAIIRIPIGFFRAFLVLLDIRPSVILSFGGYVSVPVVIAGWLLGIPSITHEQTSVIGLGTKINGFFAKKILLSWPETAAEVPSGKAVLTGNPIRKSVFEKPDKKIWGLFGFSSKLPTIFITGGNQGSFSLNSAIRDCLPGLLKISNVIHQCGCVNGAENLQNLKKLKDSLSDELARRYQIFDYLSERVMATVLKKSDLVISRAGANTVIELIALEKPCVLIPLPWIYKNEQEKNAKFAKNAGIAEILEQEQLNGGSLFVMTRSMLGDLASYKLRRQDAKDVVIMNAAERIVDAAEGVVC